MSTKTETRTGIEARVEASVLTAALRLVAPFAQGNLPVCSGVHIVAEVGKLTLECTNVDQRARTTIDAGVTQDGELIVPVKLLGGFVRSLSGAVTLSMKDEKFCVEQDGRSLEMWPIAGAEWPKFVEIDTDPIDLSDHWANIKRVLHAVAPPSEQRALFKGVHFGPHGAVATDTKRIAVCKIEKLDTDAVVPGDFLTQVAKQVTGPIKVRFAHRAAEFISSTASWFTRLLMPTDFTYPDWSMAMRTSSPQELVVSRTEMLGALSRMKLLPEDSGFRRVTLKRVGDELIMTSIGIDVGKIEEVIACGGDAEIDDQFNIGFLSDFVDMATTDELLFGIAGPRKLVQLHEEPWIAGLIPVVPATPKAT